jgi:hypothetical protein
MKRATLLISPPLLIELFKAGPARTFEILNYPLPEDARFVDVSYISSEGAIALVLESETFNDIPEKGKPPDLPNPEVRVVYRVSCSCRLV